MSNVTLTIDEIRAKLNGIKDFVIKCPHPDLLTDLNEQANDLGKQAWALAKQDMTKLPEVTEIQNTITEMTKPKSADKGQTVRRGVPGVGDPVTVTSADAVRKYLSGLEWDGEVRLGNGLYVQTIMGMDKPDDAGLLKTFCVSAIARLFKPGAPVAPLTLGGKRENVDPLSMALMPPGAGEVYAVAARNLKPERATFLTVIDGQGKPDKQDILTRCADTFRRPRTEHEVTESRWYSLIVRSGNPAGTFLPISSAPNLDLLKQHNAQIWAEAYSLYYDQTQSGKAQAAPADASKASAAKDADKSAKGASGSKNAAK